MIMAEELVSEAKQPMATVIKEVMTTAAFRCEKKQAEARRWNWVNFGLGVPATLLAGGAGVVAAQGQIGSGWILLLSVLASGLMAVSTSLNSGHRAERAQVAADSYESLAREAQQLLQVDLLNLDEKNKRLSLDVVTGRLDDLAGLGTRIPFRVRLLKRPLDG
jgi:hypothetical protein